MRHVCAFFTFVVVTLTGCSNSTAPSRPSGLPASMHVVSGNQQSDTVGRQLPQPLVVRVVDSTNAAVPNQIVNFRVTAGGGSVFAGAAITDGAGEARELWTLGTVARDTQHVEARAVNAQTGAALVFGTFSAVGTPDVPTTVTKVAGDGQSGTTSAALAESLAVKVTDQYGNGVPDTTVVWSVTSGGGTVSPQSKRTDTTGVAKTQWTLGSVVGLQTATATITGRTAVTFNATSAAPSTPTFVTIVGGNSQSGAVNGALAESLAVRVTDQNGINVVGLTVAWAVTRGGGSVSPTAGMTNASGIATARWTMGPTSGLDSATATVTGVPPARFSATAFVPLVFTSLSAGGIYLDAHTCGTTNTGVTYCWGAGGYGRLGNGAAANSATPVAVTGGQTFSAVSAGGYHTCALTSGGQAYCWGRNNHGQLGNGSTADAATPGLVSGGLTFATIDAGAYHTCGVTTSGAGYCWGGNFDGQLGDGSTTDRTTPVLVSGGLTLVSISAGGNTEQSHTCAVTTGRGAYCWGNNGFGQLGSAAPTPTTSPTPVSGALTFTTLDAGGYHTCGLTTAGAVECWGYNAYGQLGNGATSSSSTPVTVTGVVLASVNIGGWTSCGQTPSGAGYCWGWGHYGDRGDGTGADAQPTPSAIAGSTTFASISPGSYHACGLATNGAVWCWGYNVDGELGNGTTTDSAVPVRVTSP